MRVIILLGLVAFACGEFSLGHRKDEIVLTNANARIFEGVVKETIECIRQVLINGDESVGLPPLDPVEIEKINIDLNEYNWEHFKGQLELSNFLAQGHFNWRISKLSIKPTLIPIGFKLNMVLEWDSASFQGDYSIDSAILDHTISGNGAVSGSATKFVFELKVEGSLSKIKKIKIIPSLDSINFEIGQLIVDGNDVSGAINNNVNTLLNLIQSNLEEIGERIADAILEILNKGIYTSQLSNLNAFSAIAQCLPLK